MSRESDEGDTDLDEPEIGPTEPGEHAGTVGCSVKVDKANSVQGVGYEVDGLAADASANSEEASVRADDETPSHEAWVCKRCLREQNGWERRGCGDWHWLRGFRMKWRKWCRGTFRFRRA